VDLHIHSESSYDCRTTFEEFKTVLQNNIIDKIAITDHSCIGLAYKLQQEFGDRIIVGEEIMTSHGEITGLFLTQEIPAGLSPEHTIEEIKKQGGIVYIPHPFDKRRSGIIHYTGYKHILKKADILEVFNARCFTQAPNIAAKTYALDENKLQAVGSDAHSPSEIGRSYLEMDDFTNSKEFLRSLASAHLICRKMKWKSYITPTYNKIMKKLA